VRSAWRQTENNRRARYYSITPAGERQLETEREQWERTSGAVDAIMRWKRGAV
jgi:DNA-binding PadR family transcriptional regulator